MPILKERDRQEIKKVLDDLENPVRLLLFTQEMECATCEQTHTLLNEVSALSEKLDLQVRDFVKDRDEAERYRVARIPAIVPLRDDTDHGVRFYGIPAGYEFPTLLLALRDVASGRTELSSQTLVRLKTLLRPLHIQVFVTPT